MKRRETKCPAETTLEVIGGRWKLLILYHLSQGVKRFSQLRRSLSGITQKMLTQQLREMEKDGIIHREIYAEVPPRVEYSLTSLGEGLKPVVEAMCAWGVKYRAGEMEREAMRLAVPELAAGQTEQRVQ